MITKEQVIQKAYDSALWQIDHNYKNDESILLNELNRWRWLFENDNTVDDNFRNDILGYTDSVNYLFNDFLRTTLYHNSNLWTLESPLITILIRPVENTNQWLLENLNQVFIRNSILFFRNDFTTIINFLYSQGFSDENIIDYVVKYNTSNTFFDYVHTEGVDNPEKIVSPFGYYLLQLFKQLKEKGEQKKLNQCLDIIDSYIFKGRYTIKNEAFDFFYYHYPEGFRNNIESYFYDIESDTNQQKYINILIMQSALEKDAVRFESSVINVMKNTKIALSEELSLYLCLDVYFPNKYDNEIQRYIKEYYEVLCKGDKFRGYGGYINEDYVLIHYKSQQVSVALAQYLLSKKDKAIALETIGQYIQWADTLSPKFIVFISTSLKEDCLPYLVHAMNKSSKNVTNEYFPTLFEEIEQYNFESIQNDIWDYAENHSTKATRDLATSVLSKLGDKAFDKAFELLYGKTVDSRITGALFLSKINSEKALQALFQVVDTEKNDDTRDIILEALSDVIYKDSLSLPELKDIINKAEKRGKLNKFNQKWIDENTLPALYWQEDNPPLSITEVRFLFYRMTRGKGINSDIEARLVINALNKDKAGAFAKALIQAFANSGSNSKFKYYLITGGQIGGNEILNTLNSIFKKNIDEKRYKMAEYALEAMAMIGTNKALRYVEVISRKYANKRPSISETAYQALEAAALELNITTEELADRIIPDFDFEGLFKHFEADGEEYRAFINSDFTLCYFDEDNKIRKSPPKGTSAELKKEFKEIEKEVKDVVKSQNGRLEKYMIEERQWTSEQWQNFFLQNPIMFVYAMKLLWCIFDESNRLKTIFYCSEDTTLYDYEDNEVELSESDNIRIFHPIYISNEPSQLWQAKLYEMGFVSIFPQIQRPVFRVLEEELDKHYSQVFNNQSIPKGADFVSATIEKLGWLKSSGDGGRLDLTKIFRNKEFMATADIDGVYAWYQGGSTTATVQYIYFMGKNWNDKIVLKDIPPIFYSEVMADINKLIQAV